MNEDIKKALLKNRGGLGNTNDGQLMKLWLSLPVEVQLEYMNSIKTEKENANSIRSKQ